jgi:NAD+ kinase
MVVSTPAGSTGYNLANGGPVMAWGVEGYTVSFIAPHSLTARALIVAPGDTVRMINQSPSEPVDIAIDGRPGGELPAGGEIEVRYRHASALLAQTAGSTFYHRLREKFGRLAT